MHCHDFKGQIHPQQRGMSRQYLRGFNKVQEMASKNERFTLPRLERSDTPLATGKVPF